MNKTVIIIVILLIILGGAYVGRHKLKEMLGMAPSTYQTQQTSTTKTPAASSSAMAPSNNIYMTKTDSAKGPYLTDFQGMTLYTFDKDTKGVSNCSGKCAALWPVYTSGATAQKTFPENISVITRADGSKQFAWKGMPLYYYSKDQKAGDITGDGFGGIWHIVKP